MLDLISTLLAAVIGFLLVLILDPVGKLQPQWAATVFRVALGVGVGIGLTSIVFFVLDVSGAATPAAIFGADGALVAILVWLWIRHRTAKSEPAATEIVPGFRWTWLLALAFGIVLVASSARVIQMAAALPAGGWDAWAIWNLRAKFLAGPTGAWRYAVSPLLNNTHPDYPLLLSGFVARVWRAGGNMDVIAPIVTSFLFFGALVALLVSVIALLRGVASAFLAGLVILSTTSLLTWAPAQYADIPLAVYYLAAIALIILGASSDSERWALLWAGLCASFAAWTKNEGIVFLAVFVIVFSLSALWQHGPRGLVRCTPLVAGVIPGVALTFWFKFWLAPVSDPLLKQGASGLARLHDIGRYTELTGGFLMNLWHLGSGITHPLILLAILAVLVRWKIEDRYRLPALAASAILALVFLSYCGVVLITPNNLTWQLGTAFDRLILQVWPSMILIFFLHLRRIADSASVPVPVKSTSTRKAADRYSKPAPTGTAASRKKLK